MQRYDSYARRQNHDSYVHGDPNRTFWDRIWRDRNGRVVMWQTPNAWLITWAVGTTVSLFFGGHTGDVFFWIATVSLVIWSVLEISKGVDYFRRLLGLVVLVYAVASILKSL